MLKMKIIDIHDNGGKYKISPLFFSNSKPLANNPFKKRDGASSNDPIPLVNSLKVKNPKLASSISHLINIDMYFAIGNFNESGNSLNINKLLGDINIKMNNIKTKYIKFFFKLLRVKIFWIFSIKLK